MWPGNLHRPIDCGPVNYGARNFGGPVNSVAPKFGGPVNSVAPKPARKRWPGNFYTVLLGKYTQNYGAAVTGPRIKITGPRYGATVKDYGARYGATGKDYGARYGARYGATGRDFGRVMGHVTGPLGLRLRGSLWGTCRGHGVYYASRCRTKSMGSRVPDGACYRARYRAKITGPPLRGKLPGHDCGPHSATKAFIGF